ncbi:MAG: peptidoglycan-binding protein [Patescibacteria group bacterium]|nr:peptidoglycan-binding protein [Patescibacteria group bacterium]
MDKLKFALVLIITLAVVGGAGYWAVTTLQSGSQYVNNQKIKKLESENETLKQQADQLNNQLTLLQGFGTDKTIVDTTPTPPVKQTPPVTPVKKPTTQTTYKNQTLINELQKLINAKIVLKLNSTGAQVGTIQKFLNIYNKTSNKVDNTYSANTKTAVIAFQKAQGVTATGQVGSTTLGKMVTWLKKQG